MWILIGLGVLGLGLWAVSKHTEAATVVGNPAGPLGNEPNFATWDSIFTAEGNRYGVSPVVLKALAWVESNWNPGAVNDSASPPSFGIMQISCADAGGGQCQAGEFNLPDWPPPGGNQALLDPATSIHYGAELMGANLAEAGGDLNGAIAIYNSGSTDDPVYVAKVNKAITMLS